MASDQTFRFLDLPAELRICIYHYAFGSFPPSTASRSEKIAYEPTSLLRLCKQVRAEVNNEFSQCLSAEAARLEQEKIDLAAREAERQALRQKQRRQLSITDELEILLDAEEALVFTRDTEEVVLKLQERCFNRSSRHPSRWL